MAQKIVIKVQMASAKSRSKALALAAATGGVVSVELAGDDKSQVVVVGDVDSIKLTSQLRKKVGPAELVQVGDAKKEEEKKKPEQPAAAAAVVQHPGHYYCYPNTYHYPGYGCSCGCNDSRPGTCSIM